MWVFEQVGDAGVNTIVIISNTQLDPRKQELAVLRGNMHVGGARHPLV